MAATSEPMKPAPTTTTPRPRGAHRLRREQASPPACAGRGRSEAGPAPGRGRGWAPVATTRPSKRSVLAVVELEAVPVDVERAGDVTQAQVESEGVDLLGRRAAGRGRAPTCRPGTAWTAAAGRRGGGPRRRSRRPVRRCPSARNVSAARSPARDAPTTAMVESGASPMSEQTLVPPAQPPATVTSRTRTSPSTARRTAEPEDVVALARLAHAWPRARASTGARDTARCRRRSAPVGS